MHEKDINDIMFAVKEMDKRGGRQTTVFVATKLDNLPQMTPGEVDPIYLLERVTLLEKAMRSVQQCVTRHDSALAAVTNTATSNSQCAELHDLRVNLPPTTSQTPSVTPSIASHATSAPSAVEPIAHESPTDATTRPAWSTVAASRDKFEVPKYHQKKTAQKQPAASLQTKRNKAAVFYGTKSSNVIKSAPRRLELFVFNVDSSIDDERLREFITSEHVDVLEIERMSKEGAWTQSFRVLVTAPNPRCTLDNDFWPHGIGCRQYDRRRPDTRNTLNDSNI